MCVIVDVINEKKVLVDGDKFPRVIYQTRRLTLTKFKVSVQNGARTGSVIKAMKKEDVVKKFQESTAAQKLARFAKRASLSDYERFTVMVQRRKRAAAVRDLAKGAKGAAKGGKAAPAKAAPAAPAKGGKGKK